MGGGPDCGGVSVGAYLYGRGVLFVEVVLSDLLCVVLAGLAGFEVNFFFYRVLRVCLVVEIRLTAIDGLSPKACASD